MEKKYLIINLFTFLISFVTFSQVTFDFKTSQDPLGWVKAGGAQAATIVADGLAISWLGDADKVPKLKIDNANIDADLYKIIAITLINNSTEIERVRTLHFKGASGTDPSSASGTNTRYTNIDLNAGTSSETYYFNLSKNTTEWTNYNAASNDDADSDMDHISLLFTTITNGGLNIASTSGDVILEKIEFLESIPSAPRNDFDFNDTSDSEGFVGGNGVVLTQPTAGEVNLEISDASAYPKFEQTGLFSVDADTYGGVEITLINNSPKNSLSFVSPSGGNQFVAKSMNSNDPNPQTISLNLKNATNWTGEQTSWWLQLVDNPGDGAQVSSASIQIQQILFVNEVLDTDAFEQESIKISFSPNPVKSLLNISSSTKVDKVEVFNILGQKSSVQNILDNTVNFSSLPTGVYMIKVYQGNEIITTKKIIKN